ncbi:GNAT family N-acetyltransferase [Mariniflexile litorale]|uniref:GNAT family N-acetyltransferase n=1 Tax=Mariniflexile litorale TaxID=3045158 RepID=A0AAU7EG10_9FLAO|nr:GNAT family N-acetyltransferase [Mariniflexile sp. KMM 9835]MDQ8211524.1 GNAT family N-acetyltransferase [Mariniflexile sp. KMM 9835]
MGDIKIKHLSKKVLRDYLDNNQNWNNKTTAFPKCKISWLLSNDRMSEDDFCGVIAEEDQEIIGLIYMIPDLIRTPNDGEKKLYWMMYWWVSEKYNGNVLSTYIYSEALRIVKNQVIVKSYAEEATSFYKKMPFKTIGSRVRFTIFFSLDPSILLAKFKFLKPFKFVLIGFDYLITKALYLYNTSKIKQSTKNVKYEYLNSLDNQAWEFIEPLCKNDLVYKTKEYVSWQINKLQYLQTPISNKNSYTSLETGLSSNIAIHNLKVLKENEIIGFISFIVNYNELNVKYFLVKEATNYKLCVDVLMEHFITLKKKYIFTDDVKLATTIKQKFATIFTHTANKKALAHKDVNLSFEMQDLTDRDGHFY